MIKLLAFLFAGCWHKWAIIHEGPLFDGDNVKRGRPIGRWYDLQCERCGTVKHKEAL